MNRKIVKLMGTCGSGKTTIARTFLTRSKTADAIYNGKKKPEAYKLDMGWDRPLWILGPYEAICGGLDALDSDTCVELIARYGATGDNVFYESMIASGFYGRMGRLSEQWGDDHIFAFMTTPIEECIRRTEERRRDRGDMRPLDPINVIDKDTAMWRLWRRLDALGRFKVKVQTYEDVYALYTGRQTGSVPQLDSGQVEYPCEKRY